MLNRDRQTQLMMGWVLPAMILLSAFYCAADGEGVFEDRYGRQCVLTGTDIVLYFVGMVGAAIALNAHLFWGNVLWNVGYAQLGESAGLALFSGGLLAIFARQFLGFL